MYKLYGDAEWLWTMDQLKLLFFSLAAFVSSAPKKTKSYISSI